VAAALARELDDGTRVIEHDEYFAVFCPYAPHASYETWIVPRFESTQPGSLDRVAREALAVLVTRTLRRMLRVNDGADYNLVLRVAARAHWAAPWARWHLELIPRRGGDAGFELTSEMRCVLVPPEESAQVLRASHE
jgi:UDPglucose--hexose-1-phosphate uridylyltransferase